MRSSLVGWLGLALAGQIMGTVHAANVPPSLHPPGGLAPSNTPQIIVMTFDDAVTASTFATAQAVLTNRFNPNGTPVQATFFVSTDWTDYWLANHLWAAGHEIAVHTMTHTTGTNTDLATWRAEIAGCRRTLSRLARIPQADIRGFRAPFLCFNHASFQILNEQGLTYDASIIEQPGNLSLSADQMLWPYTLDNGVAQDCWTGTPPSTNFPGLFEIPLWSLYDTNIAGWVSMDPAGDDAYVLALLQYNFTAHYGGNRAPLGLFLHASQWASRTQVLRDFLDWTQAHTNVWVVNLSALTAFMQNPQTIAAAPTFSPFVTVTHPEVPEAEAQTLSFPKGMVHTCGERPTAYPAPETVYRVWAPMAGGQAEVQITGQWQTGFNAQLVLSNGAAAQAADWQASFAMSGGTITWHSSGTWQNDGARITVRPTAADPMAAGATRIITFGGTRTNALEFLSSTLTLFTTELLRPEFQRIEPSDNDWITLAWDDSAFGYRVEQATNILSTNWTPLSVVHGSTSWTGAPPTNAAAVIYRLQSVP